MKCRVNIYCRGLQRQSGTWTFNQLSEAITDEDEMTIDEVRSYFDNLLTRMRDLVEEAFKNDKSGTLVMDNAIIRIQDFSVIELTGDVEEHPDD